MNHGSLFSGIGGFDLAAEWMGWDNLFHCEWNEFGQKVLKYYWPNAKSYGDITKTDFTIWRGRIDILTGGFPCQPYSMAGKRKGKDDERHLWPEMLRAIREIEPRYVVGENVSGIVNWNGGMVFEEVQTDLENEGYEVQAVILPACAKDAPHRRDRVWFIASNTASRSSGQGIYMGEKNGKGFQGNDEEGIFRQEKHKRYGLGKISPDVELATDPMCERHTVTPRGTDNSKKREICKEEQRDGNGIRPEIGRHSRTTSDTGSKQLQERTPERNGTNKEEKGTGLDNRIERPSDIGYVTDTIGSGRIQDNEQFTSTKPEYARPGWERFPTQSPVCNGNDGLSTELDGITFPKWRSESIKAGGNAIVPQVALEIFKAIEQTEILNK